MNNKIVHKLLFSPTGTTARIVDAVATGVAGELGETVDFTSATFTETVLFTEEDLVVVGMPVYSGRLPVLAVERFKQLQGSNTPAICVVVYGNRHYDDALVELCDLCQQQGFVAVAAGAFIGEHSFSTAALPLFVDRPDTADIETATGLGKQVGAVTEVAFIGNQVPGNRPYREITVYSGCATSVNADRCTKCGKCVAVCPTGGLYMTKTVAVPDADNCIWCLACERTCPVTAHTLTHQKIKGSAQKLHTFCKERREPVIFL